MKLTATDYKKLRRRERLKRDTQYKLHLKFLSNHYNYYPSMVVVRRYKGEIYKGDGYKKCFDYWWTVD